MKLVNESDLVRLAGQLEAAAKILRAQPTCECRDLRTQSGVTVEVPACHSKSQHAVRVARSASGFLRSTAGGNGRGSDVSNPTLNAILGRDGLKSHNDPAYWHEHVSGNAVLASRTVQNLMTLVAELGKVTKTNPQELAKTGQGECDACGFFCSGARDDRLRSGYCNACRNAWDRAGRPDRAAFKLARQKDEEVA